MLIFLSDLHLTDESVPSTIDLRRLLDSLRNCYQQAAAAGIRTIQLVLLGDIFEMLKSSTWLDRNIRPWDDPTPAHAAATDDILAAIASANMDFLRGLHDLTSSVPPLAIEYLPGNHDLPVNSSMGVGARARLQELLPLTTNSQGLFNNVFIDTEHSVLAKHGHEWDPINRYSRGRSAFGDAVVIDLLLRLPKLVAELLNLNEDDPRLRFLYEIDNVRPQHPRPMARWLLAGLDRLRPVHPEAPAAIQEAIMILAKRLKELAKEKRFRNSIEAGWWTDMLFRVAKFVACKLGTLETAIHMPRGGDGLASYRKNAFLDLQAAHATGGNYRYIVCGHTHLHELVPLETLPGGEPPLYINTGTWRRCHRVAEVSYRSQIGSFTTWQEECFVILYSQEDQVQGAPRYEVKRLTRGSAAFC
jgi:UDP-2,3-diacylglucosamine pyrophosphatase LpxH